MKAFMLIGAIVSIIISIWVGNFTSGLTFMVIFAFATMLIDCFHGDNLDEKKVADWILLAVLLAFFFF